MYDQAKRCGILITLENKTIKWNSSPPAEMASCTRSSDAEVGFPFFLAFLLRRASGGSAINRFHHIHLPMRLPLYLPLFPLDVSCIYRQWR